MLNKFIAFSRQALKKDIIKVFSLTSISTLVKMLTGFVTVKVAAVLVGPSGLALIGQLNNFAAILMVLGAAGINAGVTKHISENKGNDNLIAQFLSTSLQVTIFSSLVCSIILIGFSNQLSLWILKDNAYSFVFIIFGTTLIFYCLYNLFISIINGFKEFRLFVIINIISSVFGLLFMVGLIYFYRINGALIGVVTFQSVVFLIIFFVVKKFSWFRLSNFNKSFNREIAKKYLHFTLMTLVSTASLPLIQFLIRSFILENISLSEAGIWEGMNRLSGVYLGIVVTSFTVYYLPRLSELSAPADLRKEIFLAYKVIIPTLLIGFLGIYFFRDLLIKMLFSADFSDMRSLFAWQLVGDFFKIASWLLSFIMVAKAMTKEFIITEIIFGAFYSIVAFFLITHFGILGAVQAYCINYLIYFVIMIIIFRKLIFSKQ